MRKYEKGNPPDRRRFVRSLASARTPGDRGAGDRLAVSGQGILVVRSEGWPGNGCRLYTDSPTGQPLPAIPGMAYPIPTGFSDIYLENNATAGAELEIVVFARVEDLPRSSASAAITAAAATLDETDPRWAQVAAALYGMEDGGDLRRIAAALIADLPNVSSVYGASVPALLTVPAMHGDSGLRPLTSLKGGTEGLSIKATLAAGMAAYNGISVDAWRNNIEASQLAIAQRTSSPARIEITNYNGVGLAIHVSVSSITNTPSITPIVEWNDPVTDSWRVIWQASAAITATGGYTYLLAPGATAAGSWTETVETRLPRELGLRISHGDADAITYSVATGLLV